VSTTTLRIMTRADFDALVAEGALAVDVRRPHEYVVAHVAGSRSEPAAWQVSRHIWGPLAAGRPLIVIAADALEVDLATREAQAAGVGVAGVLVGRPELWAERGLAVVGWRPLSPAAYRRLSPMPRVLALVEPGEPIPADWPHADRTPLSAWQADSPPVVPGEPAVLVGPESRAVWAAVELFRLGCPAVYRGQS
jgi:rhodanese-related sulfurtransferase